MNLKYIEKSIDKVNFVSFDVFDTLLTRVSRNPKETFRLLEKKFIAKFDKKNVMLDRIEAEKKARSNSKNEEINYEEIYLYMQNYSDEEKKWLITEELKIEEKLLVVNPIVMPIYNYCKEKQKKIIIQSDMYLSKRIISKFLSNNNIEYDYLFVSSDINKTKRKGTMYEYVKNKLKSNSILHIGDSIKSDFIMARKHKIKSILIKKNIINKNNKILPKELDSLINKKSIMHENQFYNIGFEILGPFYYSYSKWLLENFKKKNINKVFFLSRDGYVMKKAFEEVNDGIESHYLYVSRKSLIVPALYYKNTYEEMIELTNISVLKFIDVGLLINKIGLEVEKVENELKMHKLDPKTLLKGDELLNNNQIRSFYESIKEKVISNSKIQLNELLNYLKKENFFGNIGIVDIGWQGTMQKALELISQEAKLEVTINGFYIGVKKSAKEMFSKGKMFGFCFDPINNDYEKKIFAFGGLFEYFYSNDDGSVIKYENSFPKLEENEYKNTPFLENMSEVQNGGIDYIKKYNDVINLYDMNDFEKYSISNLVKFGINPTVKIVNLFDGLYYSNIEKFSMLPQHSLLFYIFNLSELKKEINQSFWKVGFMKKLLKIKLPYYRIYEVLKGEKNEKNIKCSSNFNW